MPGFVPVTEVRKGTRVQLRNGWYATIKDNTVKQHTRVAEVEGNYTETGSVYSTDIIMARIVGDSLTVDAGWQKVAHTKPQLEAAATRKLMGF